MRHTLILSASLVLLACCGGSGSDAGSGTDADTGSDTGLDTDTDAVTDAGSDTGSDTGADAETTFDTGTSCLDEGHTAGERYSVGDNCNFCDCMADGLSVCTARACPSTTTTCTYVDTTYGYAERFPSTDGCNECVCAASGLACTRRACTGLEEGAILLESMTEQCGDDPTFTGAAVLAGLPIDDVTTLFPYDRARPLYPETLPDTNLRVHVIYDGGFVVCRIPSPTQPAIDMEVVVEWITEDGAFDEGHHTYLRRNNYGFLDAWTTVSGAPFGGLDGSYRSTCLDPGGYGFSASFNADGTVDGSISKGCETDIFLDIARFAYSP